MKKLLFLGACLVALASSPVLAQTGGAQVVVVQVSFYPSGGQMTISRGEGKTEVIDFKRSRGQAAEVEAYQQTISKLYQEGYTLKSTFSDGVRNLSNLVFIKN